MENVLDEVSHDLVQLSSTYFLNNFYDKLYIWLPFCTIVYSIDAPRVCYEKNLMTVKSCHKLTIEGKPTNPLNYFIDQDYLSHAYHTQENPQPIGAGEGTWRCRSISGTASAIHHPIQSSQRPGIEEVIP